MDGLGLKGLIDYTRQKLDENYTTLETLNDAQTIDIAAIKTDILAILQELEQIKAKIFSAVLEINANTDAKLVIIENKLNQIIGGTNE